MYNQASPRLFLVPLEASENGLVHFVIGLEVGIR